jgi:hypothetical protein
LKAAILGTEDYHATMRELANSGLRRKLNYAPLQMNPDSPHLPVTPVYVEPPDLIMQILANDGTIADCNRRSIHLVVAWLLVASDNEYRICQYIDNVWIIKLVAILHIRIALGDMPSDSAIDYAVSVTGDNRAATKTAEDVTSGAWSATWGTAQVAWAVKAGLIYKGRRSAAGAIGYSIESAAFAHATATASTDAGDVAINATYTKAREWAYINDEEALQIARQLTLDILSL